MSKDSVIWSEAAYSSDRCKNKIGKQTKKPPISCNTEFFFLRLKICSEYSTPAGLVVHYLFGFFGLIGLCFWLVPIGIYLKAVNYIRNISVELVFIPYSYLVSETNVQFFFTHAKLRLARICFVHKNCVGKNNPLEKYLNSSVSEYLHTCQKGCINPLSNNNMGCFLWFFFFC